MLPILQRDYWLKPLEEAKMIELPQVHWLGPLEEEEEVDYAVPTPLKTKWEQEAIREICMIAHGLCVGKFPNAIALRDKLLDMAEDITIEQTGQVLYSTKVQLPRILE